MNVSYDWLRAFVPFRETPAKLRDLITSRVATVDELVPLRQELDPIVVARVVEAGPHPDSDHLWVTKVDAGVYISAVDPRGLPAAGDAPQKLMAALKTALGG